MRALILTTMTLGGIALLGTSVASAVPANGVAIEKAENRLQITEQARYRHHRHHYRRHYWGRWGPQPYYQPFLRLGPVWCC